MELEKIDFEKLKRDAMTTDVDKNASYIRAYSEFIKLFKSWDSIGIHEFFIGSYLVYGWMPTIPTLHTDNLEKVLEILNRARESRCSLDEDDLTILKGCLNNSMVGVSKLLHFISPKKYAIWDSLVFRYINGRDNYSHLHNPNNYLKYMEKVDSISRNKEYKELHKLIEERCGYPLEHTRAIEMVMYETERFRKTKQ